MAAAVSTKYAADSTYESNWTEFDSPKSSILCSANAGGYICIKHVHYYSAADHHDNFQSA
jgi:hypothetical protein